MPRLLHRAKRAYDAFMGRGILEGAVSDRTNKYRWTKAVDQSINKSLVSDLPRVRERCCYEAYNNAIVEGMINTHSIDLIGSEGPTLQVYSKAKRFVSQFEPVWRRWWESPDIAGQMSGVELLRQFNWQRWTMGEFLSQMVTGPANLDGITLRLNNISPRRLSDPSLGGVSNILLGIQRNAQGAPVKYYIIDEPANDIMHIGVNHTPVDAEHIIHGFRAVEPGQIRGIPLLASALQTIGEIREFDSDTLKAARLAAAFGVLLFTDHIDAAYVDVNAEVEFQPNTIKTMPPGWKPEHIKPEHPATNYVEFRHERLRELGRATGMPLMMLLLDSSNHNYSSARFDAQVYQRNNKAEQGFLERVALNRLARAVAREAYFTGAISTPIPDDVRFNWIWPSPPHVDPLKEAKGEEARIKNMTLTLTDACASNNKDFDAQVETLTREKQTLNAAGFKHPLEIVEQQNMPQDAPEPDADETPAPKKSTPARSKR